MKTEAQLRALDLPTLSDLYTQQVELLNSQLLAGTEWKELNELRGYLTQIGVAIDVKLAEKTLKSKPIEKHRTQANKNTFEAHNNTGYKVKGFKLTNAAKSGCTKN